MGLPWWGFEEGGRIGTNELPALQPIAAGAPGFPSSRFSFSRGPAFLPALAFLLPLSRRFGTKCAGCSQGISPSDLVRKARNKVFHLNCFTCMVCNKQLSTGEELYIIDENKFVCKEDYLNSPSLKEGSLNSGTSGSTRRTFRGRILPLVPAGAGSRPDAARSSRRAGKEIWLWGVRGCTPQPVRHMPPPRYSAG